jgi:transcriptional regulator with XRE-family HTH domain
VEDPAAMRRRLRVELRRLRSAADLTQREVAEALDWSPSKIIRIESGQVGITVTDLRALAGHYGVHDGEQLAALVELARNSKKQPFADYRDVLSAETVKYFGYESSAKRVRQVQPLLVPGLMQTEEYTRAVLTAYGRTDLERDRIVASRRERQELLERDSVPEQIVILDEAVLRRQVGGPGVMRNQLRHLLQLAQRSDFSILVLPFGVGAHEAMRGPFVHLEFPEATDPDVLYLEYGRGPSSFIDDPEVTALYQERFIQLEDLASDAGEFPGYVQKVIADFEYESA